VEVRCDEGLAIHIGPEPCGVGREVGSEASAGDSAGQPLSHVIPHSRVPTPLARWKATRTSTSMQVPGRPGVVEDPGMHRRSLNGNREISRLAGSAGPRREGEEPEPMMNGREKSDPA
jgi:hypothetical protein